MSSIKKKMEKYQERKEELKQQEETMQQEERKQLTLTDPDSRAMKNNGKIDVAYNMQSAVDSKHKLLIILDVVNDINDQSQLTPMVSQTNEILSKHHKRVFIADAGYYNGVEIKKCIDNKNTLYLKPQKKKVSVEIMTILKIILSIREKQILTYALKGRRFLIKKNLPKTVKIQTLHWWRCVLILSSIWSLYESQKRKKYSTMGT